MSININQIGEQIKKFRELRNLTQEAMADKLEMSSQGYGRIERNEVDINLRKLHRISEILSTTIQDILGFEDKFVFHNQECHTIGLNQVTGLEQIKEAYKELLSEKDKEIERLHALLEKTLTK